MISGARLAGKRDKAHGAVDNHARHSIKNTQRYQQDFSKLKKKNRLTGTRRACIIPHSKEKAMVWRTYQPHKKKRKRTHGFRKRNKTHGGRGVLKSRRAKGRKRIAI